MFRRLELVTYCLLPLSITVGCADEPSASQTLPARAPLFKYQLRLHTDQDLSRAFASGGPVVDSKRAHGVSVARIGGIELVEKSTTNGRLALRMSREPGSALVELVRKEGDSIHDDPVHVGRYFRTDDSISVLAIGWVGNTIVVHTREAQMHRGAGFSTTIYQYVNRTVYSTPDSLWSTEERIATSEVTEGAGTLEELWVPAPR